MTKMKTSYPLRRIVERPWPIGTELRYWNSRYFHSYVRVRVTGYTETGRVRIKEILCGIDHIVTTKSLSMQ